jgi:hypothetical protein
VTAPAGLFDVFVDFDARQGPLQDHRQQAELGHASDKGMRRFGTIDGARGRPVGEIDLDYSPLQLEDTFVDEDAKALAGASA